MPKTLPVIDMSGAVCCAPVAAGVMSDADALQVALRLKALADPVRVKLISIVIASGDQGMRNVDLSGLLRLSDATVSHHLGQLHRSGVLTRERRGRSVYYGVDQGVLGALVRVIDPNCC